MATLKAALKEVCYLELEDIPSEEVLSADDTLTFSATFERRMKKLIRRADHPIRHRVAQAAACLLLAVLLSGCTVLAISPEAREAFVGWVREVSEVWFVYHYTGETQDTPTDVVYCPTWVPDGYSQALVPELSGQVNILYKDDEGHMMLFAYSNSSSTLYLGSVGSDVVPSKVTINDISADFYLDADDTQANYLVWINPENDIIFWIGGNFSKDIMIRIAESVEAQEIVDPAEMTP